MALTNINDNFQLDAPKHLDNRTGNYASVAEANASIPQQFRIQGLEVVVITAGEAVKYYYRDGVLDEDLIIMPTGGGGGSTPTLAEVLDEGNTADEDIVLLNDSKLQLGSGGQVLLDNGSRLKEGTIDQGLGGSKGISQICAVGYEKKWEAGREYIMNDGGTTIREARYNFAQAPTINDDITTGFIVGSRWVLDNGTLYICTDNTDGAAAWDLQPNYVPYTGADEDLDLGDKNIYTNKVYLLDEANNNHASIHYTDADFHIEDADGHKLLVIEDGFIQLHKTDTIQSNLFTADLTETRDHRLPNDSGIIALTKNITKTAVGLSNVPNTDATNPANITQTSSYRFVTDTEKSTWNGKQDNITAGTTSQYYRGDKTFQALNAAAVGLGSVNNTADLDKPISTATQTALDNRSVSIATAGSVSITITATGAANLQTLTGHSFTINEALMPVGATITINGLCERIATGTGLGGISYDINGVKRYYTSPSGHQYQYQITIYRESSTTIRMMGGSVSVIPQGAFGSANIATTTAAVTAGGNIVFQLFGFGSVVSDQIAYRFFKAVLTR